MTLSYLYCFNRYSYRDWSFVCKVSKQDCLTQENDTQEFGLTFQVNFIKISQ
jgi:hypothetical protein